MKTRPIGNKFNTDHQKTFFDICHQAAACLEYTLHLNSPLCEPLLWDDTTQSVEDALAKTFKDCFSVLIPNYCFYGISNQRDLIHSPSSEFDQKDDSDPFWNSIHSQCVLSSYDTIVQLLNDNFLNPNGISGKKALDACEIANKGVHSNFAPKKGFQIPEQKCDYLQQKIIKASAYDHMCKLYSVLLSNEKALQTCGAELIFARGIDSNNNYHRLVRPNETFERFFSGLLGIKVSFYYQLKGPECKFENGYEPQTLSYSESASPNQTIFEWKSSTFDLRDFPYASQNGAYSFTLTIKLATRAKTNQTHISRAFSGIIHITNPVNAATNETEDQSDLSEPVFIDIEINNQNKNLISAIEYFPMNLFNANKKALFLYYNADFYAFFASMQPKGTYEILDMLYADRSNNSRYRHSRIDYDALPLSRIATNIPTSNDTVDRIYLKYQLERMTGCDITNRFYELEIVLDSEDIILNDEEFDTLCQLGASRNIFSRDFLLEYIMNPLRNKETFFSNSLDKSCVNEDAIRLHTKASAKFTREQWHSYTKMFLSRWNRLFVPACEWFFLLTLLRCYNINFNANITSMVETEKDKSEESLKKDLDKFKTSLGDLYDDLSNYIADNEDRIKAPVGSNHLFPLGEELSHPKNNIPFERERIMYQMANHNKTRVLDLSKGDEPPVFLNSLVPFDKNTLLCADTENKKVTHLQQVLEMYTQFPSD